MTGAAPAPVTCAACGTTLPVAPLSWTSQQTARGPQWLCVRCTREDLRSIEARLDEVWW